MLASGSWAGFVKVLVTGYCANQVDRVHDDARPSVEHDRYAINIAALTIWWRWRKHANQLRWKRLNPFLPTWRQLTRAIVFLPYSRRQVARATVVALNNGVVLTPEVMRVLIMTRRRRFGPACYPYPGHRRSLWQTRARSTRGQDPKRQ
jgi:hypothetical protein